MPTPPDMLIAAANLPSCQLSRASRTLVWLYRASGHPESTSTSTWSPFSPWHRWRTPSPPIRPGPARTSRRLFFELWWTWIGFATLYNRLGDEGPVPHRLLISAGTVPCGAAAVAVHLADRHPRGTPVSALLFGLSTVIPVPWRYLLWGAAIATESGGLVRGRPRRQAAGPPPGRSVGCSAAVSGRG